MEQKKALRQMQVIDLDRRVGDETADELMVRSVKTAAVFVGDAGAALSPASYREARKQLAATGTHIEEINKVIRHFGTWVLAKEAASLADDVTAARINARFRSRKQGKIWRYTDSVLRSAILDCSAELGGRAPRLSEFEFWRDRQLELARAAGNVDKHLPSGTPYRKRFGTWEKALAWAGFSNEQITGRFYQG